MKIKLFLIKLLNKLPYIRGLYQEKLFYKRNTCYPPGHYYSPIMSLDDLNTREDQIWVDHKTEDIKGVDLNIEKQLKLLRSLSTYYDELPFQEEKQKDIRFYYKGGWLGHMSGIILYSMIRHFKPKNIIEIGSGFSSAVMMDTNELFFKNQMRLTFIEPYPEDRLEALLKETDKSQVTIIPSIVQSVSLDTFSALQPGDILFIDSTHVSKTGSDVNYIFFEILPTLQPGVLVHFHDIHHHFEYPKKWVLETNKNWNENYTLRAFLMHNTTYEIKLFTSSLHKFHKESFKDMPLCYENNGSSIWLEKIGKE